MGTSSKTSEDDDTWDLRVCQVSAAVSSSLPTFQRASNPSGGGEGASTTAASHRFCLLSIFRSPVPLRFLKLRSIDQWEQ